MTAAGSGGEPGEPAGPVVRDRRRLDPETGRVREAYAGTPAEAVPGPAPGAGPETEAMDSPAQQLLEQAQALAAERLADLQRLQAEFVNYRRRVERDRDVARDVAVAGVMEALLPALDDIALARRHGDLVDGPFAAIADKLEATLQRLGLTRYGESGEAFDPAVHDALMHVTVEQSAAGRAAVTTVVEVLQPGYRLGERVLRAARVAVADPVEPSGPAAADEPGPAEAPADGDG